MDEQTLAWLRTQVGDQPDDAALQEIYGRHVAGGQADPAAATAREVLGRRLADFIAAPASLSVAGEITRGTGANIAALQRQLGDLGERGSDDVGLPDMTRTAITVTRWRRTR